mmetsp:Transcript_35005/g.89547  ORF Transcript_35005/g.89547 Transcript_35005/m.89547 type:complete len:328 (-) Transcript_35005:925-1908(-)
MPWSAAHGASARPCRPSGRRRGAWSARSCGRISSRAHDAALCSEALMPGSSTHCALQGCLQLGSLLRYAALKGLKHPPQLAGLHAVRPVAVAAPRGARLLREPGLHGAQHRGVPAQRRLQRRLRACDRRLQLRHHARQARARGVGHSDGVQKVPLPGLRRRSRQRCGSERRAREHPQPARRLRPAGQHQLVRLRGHQGQHTPLQRGRNVGHELWGRPFRIKGVALGADHPQPREVAVAGEVLPEAVRQGGVLLRAAFRGDHHPVVGAGGPRRLRLLFRLALPGGQQPSAVQHGAGRRQRAKDAPYGDPLHHVPEPAGHAPRRRRPTL